jgi:hypothetical protein
MKRAYRERPGREREHRQKVGAPSFSSIHPQALALEFRLFFLRPDFC